MAIKPSYVQCLPTTDAQKNACIAVTSGTGSNQVTTGIRILSATSFNCEEIAISGYPQSKGGTISIECIYKNAIGTLKLQQSVSGLIWTDITDATLSLADSGTEQVQTLNLSVGAYGGNFLRPVWTASSAGTGYLIINVA